MHSPKRLPTLRQKLLYILHHCGGQSATADTVAGELKRTANEAVLAWWDTAGCMEYVGSRAAEDWLDSVTKIQKESP